MACAPSPRMAPSTLPSKCKRPLKCTSPRTCVPAAMSVVAASAAATVRASLRLLNIGYLLLGEGTRPGDFLIGPSHFPVRLGFDTNAVGNEFVRQHECACDLLKIFERKRQARAVLVRRQIVPRERGEPAVAHAVHAQVHAAAGYLS